MTVPGLLEALVPLCGVAVGVRPGVALFVVREGERAPFCVAGVPLLCRVILLRGVTSSLSTMSLSFEGHCTNPPSSRAILPMNLAYMVCGGKDV